MNANVVPVTNSLTPGAVLGKCEIQRELGRGGMGAVYIAHHRTLDMPVAVKVLTVNGHANPAAAVERFLREARLAARIRHANLVEVMDTDTDPTTGASYMVMELVDGASISALIARGALDPVHAAHIALGVACALDAAHQQNVIHRDVKPANVLLDVKGVVKLVDLGLAKDLTFEGQLTGSAATLGTPVYMSPEQVRNAGNLDIRTDVYSLGVTLYEMLTGSLPYRGNSFFEVAEQIAHAPVPDPRALRPTVDPALAELTMKMMAKLPAERPQTPAAVAEALSGYLSRPGVVSQSGSTLRLSGLIGAGIAASDARNTSDANTPTRWSLDRPGKPEALQQTYVPGAPAPAKEAPIWRILTACSLVVIAALLWRSNTRPIGGPAPGPVERGYNQPPPGMSGNGPPPPPWWRREWGPAPEIPWGASYGPPPEWAHRPDGRPPQGWRPDPDAPHPPDHRPPGQ